MNQNGTPDFELIATRVIDAVARRYESSITADHQISPELREELIAITRESTTIGRTPAWYKKYETWIEGFLKVDIALGSSLLISLIALAPSENLALKFAAIVFLLALAILGQLVLRNPIHPAN